MTETTINRIIAALGSCGIGTWRIREKTEETAELFFVRRQLDTRRIKDTRKYDVTVFRSGEGEKAGLRGNTTVVILASMSDAEIADTLRDAFFAAQFALNPTYDLPDAVTAPTVRKTGELAEAPLAVSAGKMAAALFAPDTREDAFLNSAEIFAVRTSDRVLSSTGTDVSWTDAKLEGEFVVQCLAPEDVEMHNTFEYDEVNTEALTAQVAEALTFVCDRARAARVLKSGSYDVILSGKPLAEVLTYYAARSSAQMIFSKYSSWKLGDDVQNAAEGSALDLTLLASAPYSGEGIPMKDLPLLRGGKLGAIHGPAQFCRYLGVAPTGAYEKLRCENKGTESFAEMKQRPCLWAVTFSDFQLDEMSGHFGGEIRLAYLIEDGKLTPVTGGSINGSILDAQKTMVLSTDRFTTASYEGPYAARFADVSVAGAD